MTVIQIKHEIWEGIPLLICAKTNLVDEPLPTVVYLHGITGAKEDNLSLGYLLADRGFRVILPDAEFHGERTHANIDNVELHFFEIVQKSVFELSVIYDKLNQADLIKDHSFTLAGTSMGGITTAAALTQYQWISNAGIMMGTARLHDFSKAMIDKVIKRGVELPVTKQQLDELLANIKNYDLSLNIEQLNNRPLFIWHGEEDLVVPYQYAIEFYHQLKETQVDAKTITFVSEEKTGHKVSRRARLALTDWITAVQQLIKQER